MKREISEIISTLIQVGKGYPLTTACAILSLNDRWPNLTEIEKLEIEASAYTIYCFSDKVAEDGTIDGIPFPQCLTEPDNDNEFLNDDIEEDYSGISTSYSSDQTYNNSDNQNGFQKVIKFFKGNR